MNELFVIIGLILLNGLFSMSEIALISARKSKLTTEVKKGSKKAAWALKVAGKPDRFLSTVQIGITLVGILTGIYSGNKIATALQEVLVNWGISLRYVGVISQTSIVVVVTYFTLVFGELLPKRIGMSISESVAQWVAQPMYYLSLIASPFVWLLSKSTSLLFKLVGVNDQTDKVTEEEIKSIIQEGTLGGEVDPVEQDIMERVLMLGDLRVNAVMTHKSQVIWLDTNMTIAEAKQIIGRQLFEFYPIADGSLDKIKGVITLQALVLHMDKPHLKLGQLISPPSYFYESSTVYSVLAQLQEQNISRALICDERGAFTGIITLKDIFEALVGEINELDEEPIIIPRHHESSWLIDGKCPFHDFLDYFDRNDLFEKSHYATLAGLLLQELQHIPQSGEILRWNGFIFEIVDMDGTRIDKILVSTINTK